MRRRGGHGGADALSSLWFRYTGPDTTLSFAIMLDILLMVVIGGMGTMYGAVIGAALFIVAENYLQKLMGAAAKATEALPLLPDLLHPDRWLLWLGVLFVLSVYFSPPALWASCANPDVSPAKAQLHAPYGLATWSWGARVLAGITPYPPV